jgi:molecular chaperone DnaK
VDDRVCPEEAVARGAAIYAAQAMNGQRKPPPLQVTSISTHSLGIEGVDQRTGERTNKILIRKGTPLPAKVTREFPCKANSQRTIVFNVLEGEAAEPSACAKIGVVNLRDLPADMSEEWPVDVTYEYSQSGRLSVEAKVCYTDCSVHLETVRPAGVSKLHIAQWKKAVTALAGFPVYRNVRVWEQTLEAPGPLVVAGLSKASVLEPSRVQAFLRRMMPWAKV